MKLHYEIYLCGCVGSTYCYTTTCAQMDTHGTSSLTAFSGSLVVSPLLSQREPNCAETCTLSKSHILYFYTTQEHTGEPEARL